MALFFRILLIFGAYLVASLAAGAVATLALALPDWDQFVVFAFERGTLWPVMIVTGIFTAAFAFIPAMLVILYGESFGARSILFYAGNGALAGAVAYALVSGALKAGRITALVLHELEVFVAAGVAAGFVYWALAGRTAGLWRRIETPPR